MTDKQIILSTVGSKEEAQTIAQTLVGRQLAACVNILGPVESVYRWKGEVESNTEFLLLIKTTAEHFGSVQEALSELHSYELPECIAVNIESGNPEYLDWIENSVQ
jgi:periplasmic divalent cation tolerance protein